MILSAFQNQNMMKMFSTKKCSFYISLILLLVIQGCSPGIQQEITKETIITNTFSSNTKDSLIYLGFNILHDKESDKSSVQLANQIVKQAYLKQDISSAPTLPENKIRCSLLDVDQHIIKSTIVDNPLIEHAEYVCNHDHDHDHDHSAHEEESLKRKLIKKDEGYFGFRARYTSAVRYVLVELADQDANPDGAKLFEIEVVQE